MNFYQHSPEQINQLATALEDPDLDMKGLGWKAAFHLRELQALILDLEAQLCAIGAGGVGASIQPQVQPDTAAQPEVRIRTSTPDGWKLVPVEPTDDMFIEGMEADCRGRPSIDDDTHVRRIWRAMMSSAPDAPAQPPAATDEPQLNGDAQLAHQQCRAVAHLARSVANAYDVRASMVANDAQLANLIGETSAAAMERLGDELNSMDSASETDDWLNPIFDAAQQRWPGNETDAPQPPAQQDPVGAQYRFNDGQTVSDWKPCDIEHHDRVQSDRNLFSKIESRLIYTTPQPTETLNCKSTQKRLAMLWGYVKQEPARQPLPADTYTALAHRIATKYAHRSDPAFCGYAFLPHTLEQFVRAIEQAHNITGGQ